MVGPPAGPESLADGGMQTSAKPQTAARVTVSATLTLTLSILGSSVLPVPFAISRLGVLMGLLTMLVVSYSNALTSILLLRASGRTGHDTYEGVAEAAGGPWLRVLTRASLILLLFGTIIGDLALLSDVGTRAVQLLHTAHAAPPAWLVGHHGRVIMVLLALCPVYPLCCLKRMRSLELAGTAGVGVIAVIAAIMVWTSVQAGMPAVKDGDLPLWGLKVTKDLPEAFSVLGFAFYIQPMMMPLLHEMPAGQRGIDLTSRAVYIVVMGIAMAVYGVMGIFAAAKYGLQTQGNVLVNEWLGGLPEGILDGIMAVYLSISIPPMLLSLRYTLDCFIAGEAAPESSSRHVLETTGILLAALAVALRFPSASEKIFAITGATAVCLVCYMLPVIIHLLLYSQDRSHAHGGSDAQRQVNESALPLLDADTEGGESKARVSGLTAARSFGLLREVVIPVGVMTLGIVVSFAAVWVSCVRVIDAHE